MLALSTLYTVSLVIASHMSRKRDAQDEIWRHYILSAFIITGALYLRLCLFDYQSADYKAFLASWVQQFREGGFMMLTKEIGDYNLPYQYILALIARSPESDLYLIKLTSVMADFALALLMARMTERFIDSRFGLPVLACVLFVPTSFINGAYWAQCDALYVFFVMACLYTLLTDHPVASAALLAVAFSFKLQTIFFFPMVLYFLYHKKYKLRHALVFPVSYLMMISPALLLGRSLKSALSIYVNQSVGQYSERLTFNAPNIYQLFPNISLAQAPQFPWLRFLTGEQVVPSLGYLRKIDVMDLQSVALLFFVVVVLAVVIYLVCHCKEIAYNQMWRFAMASALFLPMVMPRMHDRYFYLADMFSILYAARYKKRAIIPVLVITASFASYMPFIGKQRPIPMEVAALMNCIAMVIIARDILRDMRLERGDNTQTLSQKL